MPSIELTPKECAMIHKAIYGTDWSYIGEQATARSIQRKVRGGAIEYTLAEQKRMSDADNSVQE